MRAEPIQVTMSGDGSRTRGHYRSRHYELTSRGVRLPVERDDPLARIRAAVVPLRDCVTICGPSSGLVLGVALPLRAEQTGLTHVIVPREIARPRRRDLVVHQGSLGPGERVRKSGLFTTSPERTFVDLAASLTLADLVAAGDSILRMGISIEQIATVIERRAHYRGKVRAREALDWLDRGAESPQESRLRVALRMAGLPRPRVNADIFDGRGRFVARGDLVFDEAMLVVEYDGAHHLTPEAQRRDAERRANLQAQGWMVLELNRYDLVDPRRAVAKVRAALRARGVAC